jgi:hypothetical protein
MNGKGCAASRLSGVSTGEISVSKTEPASARCVHALEQRRPLVERLAEHAAVELEPAEVPVDPGGGQIGIRREVDAGLGDRRLRAGIDGSAHIHAASLPRAVARACPGGGGGFGP